MMISCERRSRRANTTNLHLACACDFNADERSVHARVQTEGRLRLKVALIARE